MRSNYFIFLYTYHTMSPAVLLSKVQTAIQLLAEVRQALANQPSEASEPPSAKSSDLTCSRYARVCAR